MNIQECEEELVRLAHEKRILEFLETKSPKNYRDEWTQLAAQYRDIEALANFYYCMNRAKRYQEGVQADMFPPPTLRPITDPEVNVPCPPDIPEVDEELPGWQRAKNMGGI